MKEYTKKIISVVPIFFAVMLLYGAFSGKLQNMITNTKTKLEEQFEETTSVQVSEDGKIQLDDNWKWDRAPIVNEYDPNNKIVGYFTYGITVSEMKHREECGFKQINYNKTHVIPEKYIGCGVYRRDEVINEGVEFANNYYLLKAKYENVEICEDIRQLKEEYFAENKKYIIDRINNDGSIKEQYIIKTDCTTGEEERILSKLMLVNINITVSSESEWVYQYYMVPQLKYLEKKGESLVDIEAIHEIAYYYEDDELECYTLLPAYYDLGFYDFSDYGEENPFTYPMRKGESVTFKVGYLVPEMLLDKAYLVYDPMCSSATDESYNAQDRVLFKLYDDSEE